MWLLLTCLERSGRHRKYPCLVRRSEVSSAGDELDDRQASDTAGQQRDTNATSRVVAHTEIAGG